MNDNINKDKGDNDNNNKDDNDNANIYYKNHDHYEDNNKTSF